jgi:hypothetical protein
MAMLTARRRTGWVVEGWGGGWVLPVASAGRDHERGNFEFAVRGDKAESEREVRGGNATAEDTGMMREVCNNGKREGCVACDLRRADDGMKQGKAVVLPEDSIPLESEKKLGVGCT